MYKKKLTLSYPPLFTVFGGLSYYYSFFFSSVFVLTRSHTRFDRDDYFMVLEFVFFFFLGTDAPNFYYSGRDSRALFSVTNLRSTRRQNETRTFR